MKCLWISDYVGLSQNLSLLSVRESSNSTVVKNHVDILKQNTMAKPDKCKYLMD